jgi:arylsulfatase A-like enzyme
MTRPNIILITTDQQRADALSMNGAPELRTPCLDNLAARGVNFRRAYSTTTVCIPARRSIISGLHPATHGLNRNGPGEGKPFEPPTTLPSLLSDAGYHTYLVGKLHVGVPGVRYGFDHIIQSETPNDRRKTTHQRRNDYADWFEKQTDAPHTLPYGIMSNDLTARAWDLPEHLHQTNWVTNTAAQFLETQRDPDCPFFLHLSYWAPHQPALPPQAYWDRYADNQWQPSMGAWVPDRPWEPGRPINSQRGPFELSQIRRQATGYFGLVNQIDDQLNYLFDRWRSSPMFDDDRPTWIVFASDHGEMLGDHQMFRKTAPYEGAAHVPMFIAPLSGAQVDQPRQCDDLVCLEDILPTCCELAGVEVPDHLGEEDGRSLLPLLSGADGSRSHIHGESHWIRQHFRYLVHGDEKYIRWTATGEEQLFNLREDPHELQDRSGDADLSQWRAMVDAHRDQALTCRDDSDAELRACDGAPPDAIWAD